MGFRMKQFTARTLTTSALLVAIGVILSFVRIPLTIITEITLTGIPIAVGGFFFGPAMAALIGALIDVIGYFVRPAGPYFPGFTISSAVVGAIYGIFLWREWWSAKKKQGVLYKKNTGLILRTVIAHLVKTIAVSLFLNIIWLSKFYGMPASVVFTGTLAKEAVNFPFEAALIYLVIRALSRLGI